MNAVANVANTPFDFEFYPTTDEIIELIKSDVENVMRQGFGSMLDIGAGDGRVLTRLGGRGDKYAIEKSELLIQSMPKDVVVVGTLFEQQTLLGLKCDVYFSNPPYSSFESWATKIIRHGNFEVCYLVIPTRWVKSTDIREALKARRANAIVLGTFDFMSADRKARAVVNVIRIEPQKVKDRSIYHRMEFSDPFEVWFEENFKINSDKVKAEHSDYQNNGATSRKETIKRAIVPGCDVVAILESLYFDEMDHLLQTYKRLEDVDSELLRELNVSSEAVCKGLIAKISNLKTFYWKEVFERLGVITEKLTSDSRQRFLERLMRHVSIDFTQSNVRALIIFCIKNANAYFDEQLVKVFERMISQANVIKYKSNERTWGKEQWRYRARPEDFGKVKLDYRVVLESSGGIVRDWRGDTVLASYASDLLDDLCTIAQNLGFDAAGNISAKERYWDSGVKHVWWMMVDGKKTELFTVRAYLNGNMHITFNSRFMLRFNLEAGRLLGWVKDWSSAADEMGEDVEECAVAWQANFHLPEGTLLLAAPSEGG